MTTSANEDYSAQVPSDAEKIGANDRKEPLLIEPRDSSAANSHSIAWNFFLSWYSQHGWHGMGLMGESFLLFSVGILKPFWTALYPECFTTREVCSDILISSLTSCAILGIMVGMVAIGYMANYMGRRKGSVLTASIMSSGAVLLFLNSMFFINNPTILFTNTSILLFIFGIGVGGEYPLSAASASERAMSSLQRSIENMSVNTNARVENGRGMKIQLVFSMQGVGIFLNTFLIVILLLVTGQKDGNSGDAQLEDDNYQSFYSSAALTFIWHATYLISAMILSYVAISRYMHLEESEVWSNDCNKRNLAHFEVNDGNNLSKSTDAEATGGSLISLLFRNYWHRIVGASLTWMLWDLSFYGNKLFQADFIMAVAGNNFTLFEITGAACLNAFVALIGYFTAAFIIDRPEVGRLRMQLYGLASVGILLILCSFLPSGNSLRLFLYVLSSFFSQCGPNATTYIVPTEIFPTQVRTMCHGIAAASGKLGALVAAIYFNYSDHTLIICGYSCLFAFIISYISIPETSNLNLFENDIKWHMIMKGKKDEYDGPANYPENCSYYERMKTSG